MKRVFLIVLDSMGIGAASDAADFGDEGTNTLLSCYKTGLLNIPNLTKMGLGNTPTTAFLTKCANPSASVATLCEKSLGKDTTTGHWEMAGIISSSPFPTYPNGFPSEITDEFSRLTGRGILCNKPYSGTKVIEDYGEEHLKSGKLIVYTSSDSVFQIAAHISIVSEEQLYEYCAVARRLLSGKHAVGRVIARPFTGSVGAFSRTANRRDFSLKPPKETMLDVIKKEMDVISVGKISDIFAAQGITRACTSHSNSEGMNVTLSLCDEDFTGLCFTNLVDFDMLYGHRRNAVGYAEALNEFDKWLYLMTKKMNEDDALIITADHGCDPMFLKSTDHTRENVPCIIYSPSLGGVDLGVHKGFGNIAKTVCDLLGVCYDCEEEGFYDKLRFNP